MDFTNKVAIVTGASEGIGLATARALAGRGVRVVLAARSSARLAELERELPNVLAVTADLRNEQDIERIVRETMEKFGRVDILINNAGQAIYGRLTDISIEDYRTIIELNILGATSMMQHVAKIMRSQESGSIVNVSSGTSRMVLPGIGAYAATKAALNMLSLVAREELAPSGITVSVIYPFITATRFAENAIGERPTHARVPGRPAPHAAEFVAEKILELLNSGEAEMDLRP